MRAPTNLLRNPIAALHQRYAIRYLASQMRNCLRGARNPHVLSVHSGLAATNLKESLRRNFVVCAPCALLSDRSQQFVEALK